MAHNTDISIPNEIDSLDSQSLQIHCNDLVALALASEVLNELIILELGNCVIYRYVLSAGESDHLLFRSWVEESQ